MNTADNVFGQDNVVHPLVYDISYLCLRLPHSHVYPRVQVCPILFSVHFNKSPIQPIQPIQQTRSTVVFFSLVFEMITKNDHLINHEDTTS